MIQIILGENTRPVATWQENDVISFEVRTYINPNALDLLVRKKELSWPQYGALIATFQVLGVSFVQDDAVRLMGDLRQRWAERITRSVSSNELGRATDIVRGFGLDLREPQVIAIQKLFTNPLSLLAAVCGTGKTLVVLLLAAVVKAVTGSVKLLVVAPKAVCDEYQKELGRVSGLLGLTIENLTDLTDIDRQCLLESSPADILVIQVESAHKYVESIRRMAEVATGSAILCVDEGHAIKNMGSLRYRAVDAFAPFFDRMIVSTATPTPMEMADMRAYLNTVYRSYPADSYIGGIPPEDFDVVGKIAYVSLETDLQYAPLREINHYFRDSADRLEQMHQVVIREIQEGRKVLVFCSTNRMMEEAYARLQGISKLVLSGTYFCEDESSETLSRGVTKELQRRAIDLFNHSAHCDVLLVNFKVGATGLNLQHSGARVAIFLEITNNGAELFQSRYRLRRPFVFPDQGFEYLYFIENTQRSRSRVTRQFLKLAHQQQLLTSLRTLGEGFNAAAISRYRGGPA